jgi:hypothetical protein
MDSASAANQEKENEGDEKVMGCPEGIIDRRQEEEALKQWRKEHPEDAAASDELWEELKSDHEKLKSWMESKGFIFPDKSTETLAAKNWRKRAMDWLKKKEKPEKTVRLLRRLAFAYAGAGGFCVAIALWSVYNLAMTYAAGKPYTTLDLTKLPEMFNALSFLTMANTLAGTMLFAAGLLIFFSLWTYTLSLEKRITILEKKQVEKH